MKIIVGVTIGGVAGFGLWYFGRCTSGGCPLTSNPIITVLVGAFIGYMLSAKR